MKNIEVLSSHRIDLLWDKKSGKLKLTLKHNNIVKGAKFSKDENEILSWRKDKTVKIWDKKSGKKLLI